MKSSACCIKWCQIKSWDFPGDDVDAKIKVLKSRSCSVMTADASLQANREKKKNSLDEYCLIFIYDNDFNKILHQKNLILKLTFFLFCFLSLTHTLKHTLWHTNRNYGVASSYAFIASLYLVAMVSRAELLPSVAAAAAASALALRKFGPSILNVWT